MGCRGWTWSADPRRGLTGPFSALPRTARDAALVSIFVGGGIGGKPPCAINGESAVISMRRPELRLFVSVFAALKRGDRFRLP